MAKRHRFRRHYPRRYFKRRSHKMTIPIAPIAGLAAGIIPPAFHFMESVSNGNPDPVWLADELCANYTGVVGIKAGHVSWQPANMMQGLLPLVAGILIHKFVGGRPLNVNATLSKANVPFIRI